MKSWQPRKEDFSQISDCFWPYFVNSGAEAAAERPIPLEMQEWLSRLSLLYGVPFNYLVPDENMLPVESIRFFYLDNNWIDSILDGAASIGRNTFADAFHDSLFMDSIRTCAYKENVNVRRQLLGKARLAAGSESAVVYTGFLLRSVLISAFPGLEVQGFSSLDDTRQPLEIVRMETLSEDVMICIFKGELQRLEIHEPPEGLHFGGDLGVDGKYTRPLRQLNGNMAPIGSLLRQDGKVVTAAVPMRGDGTSGVVDVTGLVNTMEMMLKAHQAFDTYFTSAEFAVEMLETAQRGVFDNKKAG
jgi:hypothetical protein